MRLVQKLSLAFMLGTGAILVANGYFRVRREVALFEADRARDRDLIGRTLAVAVAAVWRSEGREQAMRLVDAANAGEGRVRVRWVWVGAGGTPDVRLDAGEIARLPPGESLTRIARGARGDDERFTYAVVRIGGRTGALELVEPLDAERSYTRRTIIETADTTLVLAVMTALLSYLLGSFFVGRPVRALVDKARRIGRGDFGAPVRLRSRDELSELAAEMNTTSDALVAAHERVARETAARIAALEQLRHADRLTTVGKLASGVAHELGTPLNVIAARAEMIRAGEASLEEAREYGSIIVESTKKMTRIIRQLLELARRRGPRKERRDVAAVAERTLELLRPIAERQHVVLTLCAPERPYEASIDAAQVEQALTNLVVNAVQAMKGAGAVEVRVGRERKCPPADCGGPEAEWIAVRVCDEGHGISPEALPHIFEPFFTTKDVGSGTGLGLSVTYGIVRDHGGWIDVVSQPGLGSTFALFLPLET